MNDKDRSTSLPTILVVLMAMFGMATLPQGLGGRDGKLPPQSEAGTGVEDTRTGHSHSLVGETLEDLGPLKPLWDYWHYRDIFDDIKTANIGKQTQLLLDPRASNLRFLIVAVPDPDDTSVSHEFDPTLAAVLRATESLHFVCDRFEFPWQTEMSSKKSSSDPESSIRGNLGQLAFGFDLSKKERDKPNWPASVLCRRSNDGNLKDEKLLLLLLVPESPIWGFDKERLSRAIELVKEHHFYQSSLYEPIRIVGPMYSGSFSSMGRVLSNYLGWSVADLHGITVGAYSVVSRLVVPQFVIYNGSAQTLPESNWFSSNLSEPFVRFRSTVHREKELVIHLKTLRNHTSFGKNRRIALLVESSSEFGSKSREQTKGKKEPKDDSASGGDDTDNVVIDRFTVPMGISRIRQEYTARGYYQGKEPIRLAAPEQLSLQAMTGKPGDRDLVPVYSKGTTAVEAELELTEIFKHLEQGRYDTVGILTTNAYDALFLAYKVREACPNVRLSFTSSTSILAHHDIVPYTRGSIVASSYPPNLSNQLRTTAGQYNRIGFQSYFAEGVYNAALANLAELWGSKDFELLDYGLVDNAGNKGAVPPVWISIVGERGLYPIRVMPGNQKDDASQGSLYQAKGTTLARIYLARRSPRFENAWVVVFLAVAASLFLASLWYLWVWQAPRKNGPAPKWWPDALRVSQRLDKIIREPAAGRIATLSISAGVGLLLLQGLPAWGLVRLVSAGQGGWGWISETLLVLICGFLGLVVGLLAFAFGLLQLFRNRKPKESRMHGWFAVTSVTLVAFLQVALPLAVVGEVVFPHPGELDKGVKELTSADWENLRYDCERFSRLTSGVTPLMPLLLIGVAGAVGAVAGIQRLRFHERIKAAGTLNTDKELAEDKVTAASFGPVRDSIKSAVRHLGHPLGQTSWIWPWPFIVAAIALPLFATALLDLPGSLEVRTLQVTYLIAYFVMVFMLEIRLYELIGLCRVNSRLCSAVARLPLSRAFDRLPTGMLRPAWVMGMPAAGAPDPLIARQCEALAENYDLVRPAFEAKGLSVAVEKLRGFESGGLTPDRWWTAADALLPALAHYWARRPVIATFATGAFKESSSPDNGGASEWTGFDAHECDKSSRGKGTRRPRKSQNGVVAVTTKETLRRVPTHSPRQTSDPVPWPEQECRWLAGSEELIALVLSRYLQWLREYRRWLVASLVVGLLTMTLAVTSYPFQPQGPMVPIMTILATVTAVVVVKNAVVTSRDEVTSRITKTTPNRFTFDREFAMTLFTSVMPLLGLLALSYGLSDLIRSWFEPLFR